MNRFIERIFNLKKHPDGVFFLALPLFSIGLFALVALAIVKWRVAGDFVYAIILTVGLVGGWIALQPAIKIARRANNIKAREEKQA